MTRVIAAAGRRTPSGRPAGHRHPPHLRPGARGTLLHLAVPARRPAGGRTVLDLYAGSGAVGLEALSRGGGHALLVEADARAARIIRENVKTLGLPGAEVRWAKRSRSSRDRRRRIRTTWSSSTPYAVSDDDLREILLTLRTQGWLAAEALVTVERGARGGEFSWPDGFDAIRARRYGEGTFWYGRAASTCEDAR